MEENLLRLHDLNKRVAEARKRVEYLKNKTPAKAFTPPAETKMGTRL